jgi:hypothetical protein
MGRIVLNALFRPSPKITTATDAQSQGRRHDSADEVDKTGADQISNAFHVIHDPRHEDASLVRVVERYRQASDMRLHLDAQLRDHSLGGF